MYSEMYLMLTELCPNRCQYCYIKNRDNPSSMTLDLIYDKIEQHKPTRVLFFGGEPLVRLDLIEQVMKKYYGKIKFQIVTSTSVNWEEFLEFNKHYSMNEVQVSWDGLNKNRINTQGKSIADKVLANINNSIGKLKFDIKTVISNDNVKQMVDLHNWFKEFQKHGVSGQFVLAHRTDYTDDYYDTLAEVLPQTFELEKVYSNHLNMIIAYLSQSKFVSCDVGKYMVIDPQGRETCCTALSQEKDKEFTLDELQADTVDPTCKQCKYWYMCDGGCRYERYKVFGDDWKHHHLESTCRTVEIYNNSVKQFINGLSTEQTEKLTETILRYKKYLASYYREI